MKPERQVRELTVQLPASAPQVRITAGMGSAGQKTWNVRRPVTLIGAKRPAHIVLHDPAISNAHCVVVNTGTEILLRDLHTSGGTYHNRQRVDIAVLKDGDLLRLGDVQIQIAIHAPELRPDDSGCGIHYADPTRFPLPVHVQLAYTEMQWRLESAVALIGRHEAADIRLDHPELSPRHAVIFRFQDGPALFDISDRTGVSVNSQPCSLTPLSPGDQVNVGPFALIIAAGESNESAAKAHADDPPAAKAVGSNGAGAISKMDPPAPPLEGVRSGILESWKDLNAWDGKAGSDDADTERRLEDLKAREAELDARDAALRGKLHDVTRYHEEVLARERDLGAATAGLQAEADELAVAKKAFEVQQKQFEELAGEVRRREHMLSQRWSRLQSLTCPHCGQAVSVKSDEAK